MKPKLPILIFIVLLFSAQLFAQDFRFKVLLDLSERSKYWSEGFKKNTGNNEFSYHSFRNDVSESMISRCNTEQSIIEWETGTVRIHPEKNSYGFLWIAALDLTTEKQVFDVYFNDIKRFEIKASTKIHWTTESKDGGMLSFTTIETDQHGDAHGYMSLVVPKSWIHNEGSQKIKIVGRPNDSNTWIIVYQAEDALSFLHESMEHDIWMEMVLQKSGNKFIGMIDGPITLAGQSLTYIADGVKGKIKFEANKDISTGKIILPLTAANMKFELNDSKGEVFEVKSLGEEFESSKLLAQSVLVNRCVKEGTKIRISASRSYKPKTVTSLLKLSESVLGKGRIFLMNSSHQDIAWMDSPEKCVLERDTMLLSPLFELAQKDKSYRFDVEDALMIKEFVERHPDKKDLVKQLLNDGRISCGSTFIQPYEEMYSGESLARQFYLGAKWLKDEFGYNANVYWNEDVPGRTLQMMQLMRKAGTRYMMISRHERGLFNWYSPDGSYITGFSPGHYANAFTALQKNFHEAAQFLGTTSLDWEKYYTEQSPSPVIPLLSDWDMSPAIDYSELINQWELIDELQNKEGEYVPVRLPKFRIASAPEFFDAMVNQNPKLKEIRGERPAVWLYIHGPSHQKALKASREGDILLTQAEKFATANAFINGSFKNYPEKELNDAWEAKIYPDHGWGGKQGEITDALFHSKFEFAKTEAEKILKDNLKEIAAKIKTRQKNGRPLVVFNSMNLKRNDPVCIDLKFDNLITRSVELKDENGIITESQLSDIEYNENGSIKSATLHFIAKGIPPIGYKTWYLKGLDKKPFIKKSLYNEKIENQYYAIRFANGGIESIFDKELQIELIEPGKFKAGEIFTMRSVGNGAGEFSDIQQPDMEGFDRTGLYKTDWIVKEDGPVFTVYKYRQKIRNAFVEQNVKVYHKQKRIDFETDLLNWEGELYREYRMALPLNMPDGQVAYEVPFGTVEVGKDELEGAAGERYTAICKEMHPRGIENWIGASNHEFGVTLSSSVVAADWIDPTDNPVSNPILQPILLASRKSCHWEGNEYLQTGDHHFSFSFTSHKPGWQYGAVKGRQSNEKLRAIWADNSYSSATLPQSLSFFSIDEPLVMISTVKKAEDSNDIVIRLVELEGKDKNVYLESFIKLNKAFHTTLIEEELKPLSLKNNKVEFQLGHNSIETIKVK